MFVFTCLKQITTLLDSWMFSTPETTPNTPYIIPYATSPHIICLKISTWNFLISNTKECKFNLNSSICGLTHELTHQRSVEAFHLAAVGQNLKDNKVVFINNFPHHENGSCTST